MMRDFDKNPYTPDEMRVAEFFFERGTGGGDDPIGAILAGYAFVVIERNNLRTALSEFATAENWNMGARFDPNNPRFDGQGFAQHVLENL